MKHFLQSIALVVLRILKQILIYVGIALALPLIIVFLGCLMPFALLFIAWSTFDKAENSIQNPVKRLSFPAI